MDKNIGKIAGEFINKFGRPYGITISDALTGASAKINDFKLWTLNKKHYPMFSTEEFWR